jgi:IPT/TIG domain/Abnormal spindle-like microcephaly-assoc'd, ASPM-SPD-2-Hydin
MSPIRSPKMLAAAGLTCLLSGLTITTLTATPAGAYLGEQKSQTFTEVGKTLDFTVPADASAIHIRAVGGNGADGRFQCTDAGLCRNGGTGGHGGVVDMDLPVTTGQDIRIVLGSAGTFAKPGSGGAGGGFAGQDSRYIVLDDGVGNGGGATYIYRADASVIAAAAGGGGGGGASAAGENPAGAGGDGGDGVDGRGFAGHGGLTAGAGGSGSSGHQSGGNGQSAASDVSAGGGGGGGGGYQPNGTGGGAGGRAGKELLIGGAGGGGAGGHSFSIASNAVMAPATGYGDGQVVITWASNQPTSPTTGTLRSSANPSWLGEPVTFTVELLLPFRPGVGHLGTLTIGTIDPATGGELPQSYWDLNTKFTSPPLFWTSVLPTGLTQVWASYSGDTANGPWKSPIFTQLVGPVRPRAVLVLPSSSVDFGAQSVGTVTTKTVTVENISAAPWKVTTTALSSPHFRMTGGTCGPTALDLKATCTVELSFRPTGVPAESGTLTLTDEVGNPTVITMAGSGIAVTPGGPPPAPAAPTVTAISPATGSRKGGTLVTITGTNLVNVTGIRFGSNPASQVTCTSATTCQAMSPRGSEQVNIRVITPAGTSPATPASRFRYTG